MSVITTPAALEALPDGAAIVDKHGDVGQRVGGAWHFPETAPMTSSKVAKTCLPATVIYLPGRRIIPPSVETGTWDAEQGGGRWFRSRGVIHEVRLTEHPEHPEGQRWLLDVTPFGAAWISEDEATSLAGLLAPRHVRDGAR